MADAQQLIAQAEADRAALNKYKQLRNKYDMTDMIVDFNQCNLKIIILRDIYYPKDWKRTFTLPPDFTNILRYCETRCTKTRNLFTFIISEKSYYFFYIPFILSFSLVGERMESHLNYIY